jgi:hypothetical protein
MAGRVWPRLGHRGGPLNSVVRHLREATVTKNHIIREIQRTAASNGGKPLGRLKFASETGIREADWRGRYWARWNDAVREAGFEPNKLTEAYEDETLLLRFTELTKELGRVPVVSELQLKARQDKTFPTSKVFERFGSKRKLLLRVAEHLRTTEPGSPLLPILEHAAGPEPTEEEETSEEAPIGSVYILKSGRYFKIGRSNAAGRREREIALQLPDKATMVHVIQTDDPIGIEAYWHSRFADRRKNGEWFELKGADLIAFKRRKFM